MSHNLCIECAEPLIYPRDYGLNGHCKECYEKEI